MYMYILVHAGSLPSPMSRDDLHTKDGHRPGWICRYFRGIGSRRAGKFKPGISRPGGKYRKLTTAAAAAAVTAAVICGKYRKLTPAAAAAAVTAARSAGIKRGAAEKMRGPAAPRLV